MEKNNRYDFRRSTVQQKQKRNSDNKNSGSKDDTEDLFNTVSVHFDKDTGNRTMMERISSTRYKYRVLDPKQFAKNQELVKKILLQTKEAQPKPSSSSTRSLRSSRNPIPKSSAPKDAQKKKKDDVAGTSKSKTCADSTAEMDVFEELKTLMKEHTETEEMGVSYEIQLRLEEGVLHKGYCFGADISPEELHSTIESKSVDFNFELMKFNEKE